MKTKERILVCPLNWGLGHATRCIPIIHALIEKGFEVLIAADGNALKLLEKEFPQLLCIHFADYNISYSKKNSWLHFLKQVPKLIRKIRQEHKQLNVLIRKYKINGIISDNRFGLWTKQVPCVYITHQLRIKAPFIEGILQRIHQYYIEKYTACWVPDFKNNYNLSGSLGHPSRLPEKVIYIGPLSRFTKKKPASNYKYNLLVILSGPEPQRRLFETHVVEQLNTLDIKTYIVRGLPDLPREERWEKHYKITNYLTSTELQKQINESELILSRSGYSTIMDLAAMGKKALFVPTPGQTEQLYLAEKLREQKICYSQTQKTFDLKKALEESKHYKGFQPLEKKEKSWDTLFALFKGK